MHKGLIPTPSDAPLPKPKPAHWMDGVEVLHSSPVLDGLLEGCVRTTKDFPGWQRFKEEQEIARYLKEQMELKYKKYWQVVVASSTIGCMVGHESNYFIHFRYNNFLFILYRIPDPENPC